MTKAAAERVWVEANLKEDQKLAQIVEIEQGTKDTPGIDFGLFSAIAQSRIFKGEGDKDTVDEVAEEIADMLGDIGGSGDENDVMLEIDEEKVGEIGMLQAKNNRNQEENEATNTPFKLLSKALMSIIANPGKRASLFNMKSHLIGK